MIDVRRTLPSVRVPALIMHTRGDQTLGVGNSEYLAAHIPNAKLVVVDGDDHLPWLDCGDAFIEEIRGFVSDAGAVVTTERTVTTIMFTDIVDSTRMIADIGDHQWRDLLERHNELVRREIAAGGGREINTTGDGFVACFDSPARAIQSAEAVRAQVGRMGVEIRAGLHTGECEVQGDSLAGMALHIAARIADLAPARGIFVSRTVRDLVAGSGIVFERAGARDLKGVPEPWELYEVVGGWDEVTG